MGAEQSHRQIKRDTVLRADLQLLDRIRSGDSISLLLVRALGSKPAHGAAELFFHQSFDERLIRHVAPAGIDGVIPGIRIVVATRPDVLGYIVVIDLSNPRREITRFTKHLR